MRLVLPAIVVGVSAERVNHLGAVLLALLTGVCRLLVSELLLVRESAGVDLGRTWVGQVGLVALDRLGNVLRPLVELLHVVGDDGLVSCRCHGGCWCRSRLACYRFVVQVYGLCQWFSSKMEHQAEFAMLSSYKGYSSHCIPAPSLLRHGCRTTSWLTRRPFVSPKPSYRRGRWGQDPTWHRWSRFCDESPASLYDAMVVGRNLDAACRVGM